MDIQDIIPQLIQHVTAQRWVRFNEVAASRTRYITVVLEDIYQPHNASAVMRTCDCFGIQDVHVIENRHDYVINPEVALGSTQWLDLHRHNTAEVNNSKTAIDSLRAQGYRLVATSPHAKGHSPSNLPLDQPIALLMGTEGKGLSDLMLEEADEHLRIPMYGFTESFNISVSAAIILNRLNERLRSSHIDWKLSKEAREELLYKWLLRSIRNGDEVLQNILAKASASG